MKRSPAVIATRYSQWGRLHGPGTATQNAERRTRGRPYRPCKPSASIYGYPLNNPPSNACLRPQADTPTSPGSMPMSGYGKPPRGTGTTRSSRATCPGSVRRCVPTPGHLRRRRVDDPGRTCVRADGQPGPPHLRLPRAALSSVPRPYSAWPTISGRDTTMGRTSTTTRSSPASPTTGSRGARWPSSTQTSRRLEIHRQTVGTGFPKGFARSAAAKSKGPQTALTTESATNATTVAVSRTTPGVVHQLRRGPAGWECSCPGYRFSKRPKECHHVHHTLPGVGSSDTNGRNTSRQRMAGVDAAEWLASLLACRSVAEAPVPSPGECVNCLLFPYEEK